MRHTSSLTEVPNRPERIVSLGLYYDAALLPLGLVPVGSQTTIETDLDPFRGLLPSGVDLSAVRSIGGERL